jgi:plastocyanin
MLGSCVGEQVPVTEVCDGVVDDDCDGTADDGCACVNGAQRSCYTGAPATAGVGPCHAGTETCVAGAWAGCAGEVVPVTESCNVVDDDCDGSPDNDEADAACASGVCTAGACQAASCFDEVKNGDESDVDCGGSCSTTCALGKACGDASDCANQQCLSSICSNLNGCNPTNATDQTAALAINVAFGGTNGQNYNPKCLRVKAGTIVTFLGNLASHPLIGGVVGNGVKTPAESGPFIPISNVGTSKAFELASPGTYPYYCNPHAFNGMSGVVYVVP